MKVNSQFNNMEHLLKHLYTILGLIPTDFIDIYTLYSHTYRLKCQAWWSRGNTLEYQSGGHWFDPGPAMTFCDN